MESLCMCGCGQKVNTVKGIPKKFVSGHNKANTKPPVYISCIHCGTKRKVFPHLSNMKFCSAKCRDDFRKARRSEDHPQYKRVEEICRICGNKFMIAPQRIKNHIRYCSPECGNKAKGMHMRTIEPNGKALRNGHLKQVILERDNYKCKICGFSAVIEVHHIVPRSKGGKHRINNLITLCPNHHVMVHKGMLGTDELLSYIT